MRKLFEFELLDQIDTFQQIWFLETLKYINTVKFCSVFKRGIC